MTKRTSLFLPSQIPLAEWRRIGRQIVVIHESSTWWLGDWLVYGQAHYPDRYKRAIAETSLDYQTLRNYAWVARRFVVSRRRDSLSFQHHADVASLPEDQQDEWLDRVEKFALSRNELRNRIRISRAAGREDDRGAGEALDIQMNIPSQTRQRWQEAAASVQQDLLTWIVSNLDQAAKSILDGGGRSLVASGETMAR